MYYLKSALKIITYIFVSIVLMLFFLFIFTYNFDSVKEKTTVNEVELKTYINSKISESKLTHNPFNEINVNLGEELTNDIINYLIELNNEAELYDSKYWTLKKLDLEIENDEIILLLYADYHDILNYPLIIKTSFNFIFNSDEIILEFNDFKIGSITVPDRLVSLVLKRVEENTIGSLFTNTMANLDIIEIDYSALTLRISKENIIDALTFGKTGDFIFGENSALKAIGTMYITYLYNNNQLNLTVKDGLNLNINCSKIKNVLNEETSSVNNDLIEEIKINKTGTLTNPGDIFNYNNSLLYSNDESMLIRYLDSNIIIDDNDMYIKLDYDFMSYNSELLFKFEKENNKYYLDEITLGKDDQETNSYLHIKKNDAILILNSLGIDVDKETYELNMSDLFYIDGLTLTNYSISDGSINLTYQD